MEQETQVQILDKVICISLSSPDLIEFIKKKQICQQMNIVISPDYWIKRRKENEKLDK